MTVTSRLTVGGEPLAYTTETEIPDSTVGLHREYAAREAIARGWSCFVIDHDIGDRRRSELVTLGITGVFPTDSGGD